jgi:signal transduction histidine kinase
VLVSVAGTRHPVAAAGLPTTGAAEFELRHHAETVGWLAVLPRAGEPSLEARDVELLSVIADQAAPAIAALRLREQLQLARQSLVSAREQERLRLRRELHDGLGATLAGVRLQVESAQAIAADSATTGLLASASVGVAHAVAEVRSLTENLRPPALDELGLARALQLLAERHATPALRVDTEVGALPAIEPAVEVAAYRIVAEALTNVGRHSGARQASLRVVADEAHLVVQVVDDGRGLHARSDRGGTGLGLASMRTRAEEIGGRMVVAPGPDGAGTSVRAELPLRVSVSG